MLVTNHSLSGRLSQGGTSQNGHAPLDEVFINPPNEVCPICKKKGTWCQVSRDRPVASCRRESNGAFHTGIGTSGETYHLHSLDGVDRTTPPDDSPNVATPADAPDKADSDFLHEVYSEFLGGLGLTFNHRSNLRKRGLTDAEIDRRGYRSYTSAKPSDLLRRLWIRHGDRLFAVPGFFANKNGKLSLGCVPSLMIPVRDVDGRISGIKYRPDAPMEGKKYLWLSSKKHGGPSSKSSPHVPIGIAGPIAVIRITEGPLKADIATSISDVSTIGADSVSTWRPALKLAIALGAETIRVAFDADWRENPKVAAETAALADAVVKAGLTLQLEDWDPADGKGIDDVLSAGKETLAISGDRAVEILKTIKASIAAKQVAGKKTPGETLVVESIDDPHRIARVYLNESCYHPDGATIRFHQGQYLDWDGSAYRPKATKEVNANLVRVAKDEFDEENREAVQAWRARGETDSEGNPCPPPQAKRVGTRLIGDISQALGSLALLPGAVRSPSWINDDPPALDPVEVIPCRNALVHIPSLVNGDAAIMDPTPSFFGTYALNYNFDLIAAEPKEWLEFLRSLWPDDPESIGTLQEWFGYCLTPDTSQHKILVPIGPKRSGKGTIARVLRAMIGAENVAGPTLGSLATNFGLAPLIGKPLAIISDARLSARTDQAVVVERLLTISGQDALSIDRKHLPAWEGQLPTRLVLISNELPRLNDASGALAGRFIILRLTHSFYGKEDRKLFDRLVKELPGILLWAIAGWKRLHDRGHFIQPQTGRELVEQMEDLSSPIGQFLRERCEISPTLETDTKTLYLAWKMWCEAMGRREGDHLGFGRDLHTALPDLKTVERSRGSKETRVRSRVYVGIGLKTDW